LHFGAEDILWIEFDFREYYIKSNKFQGDTMAACFLDIPASRTADYYGLEISLVSNKDGFIKVFERLTTRRTEGLSTRYL
tara:strand:+ start:619 stop:858 length:240 start_codon:yes stop_codon:yes gene_type:complete